MRNSKKSLKPSAKGELRNESTTKLLFPAIIILVSVAVYFNTLYNGFVYDDKFQILRNYWIKDMRHIPEIFSANVAGFYKGYIAKYYRPLMYIIYMLIYSLFGLNPLGFHLVNILFHAGVSVVVFLLVSRLLRNSDVPDPLLLSFMSGLLFATHPIHGEAVAWAACLPELSFTFFYLLSFYLYLRISPGGEFKRTHLLWAGAFLLSALSKETALTLPILFIAYDYTFRRSGDRFSDHLKRYVPYLVIAGIYVFMRVHALGAFVPVTQHRELSLYQCVINVFPLFAQYLEKLILPINLNAFYVFHPIASIFEMKGILSLVTSAFVVVTFFVLKKSKIVYFSLLFIAIPLLPVLYIPGVGENTFAERYLYLPSIGFVLLLVLLLNWIRSHIPNAAFTLMATFLVLTGTYSAATVSRNSTWKDDLILWTDTAKKSPDSFAPHNNLGDALLAEGHIDEAIRQFEAALKLNPNYAEAYNNLGTAFYRKGLVDKAIEQYHTALRLQPKLADAYNNLGVAYDAKGLIDQSIEQCQIALRLQPDYADAHLNLGVEYGKKGLIEKAIEHFQVTVRLRPSDFDGHSNLGNAYGLLGLTDQAIEQFQIALMLQPSSANGHYNIAMAYMQKGLIDRAVEHLEIAARLDPAEQRFRNSLNKAYEQKRLGR